MLLVSMYIERKRRPPTIVYLILQRLCFLWQFGVLKYLPCISTEHSSNGSLVYFKDLGLPISPRPQHTVLPFSSRSESG